MRKAVFTLLLLFLAAMAPAWSAACMKSEVIAMTEEALVLSVDGQPLDVRWESNETVAELTALARQERIVVAAAQYGGFEQVGSLPQSFTRDDVLLTTAPGDIVLYAGDQLVLFFGSNTWSYTRLGAIDGLSADTLSALLKKDTAVIEITIVPAVSEP